MDLNDMLKYGNIGAVIIALVMIAISGIFFGVIYFLMDTTQDAFESTDCVIDGNGLWSTCQEMWDMALYPFLNMKDILIWTSFLFIFVLVIAMLLLGYQSGFKPVMLGFLVIVELLITYGSLYIANMYRTLVSNAAFREILSPFTVYNKIMLNFPWFVFIVSLFSLILGIVNWQRTRVNNPTGELDY